MKYWYRPTIARRILIAALIAFMLTFVVITIFNVYQIFRNQDGALDVSRKAFVESLGQSLAQYETDEQIRAAAEGIQRMIVAQALEAKQPSTARILVWSHDGRQIYASIHLPQQQPSELASAASDFNWEGLRYSVTSVVSPRYTVEVLDSMPKHTTYKLIMRDLLSDLLLKMAIAFPLVLFPIWFAIHSGLRPLDALTDTLRHRSIDDLTPIASNMQYEELKPVSKAINDLLERLRSKIQQEQSFVHDAAHELQTPLAVIATQTHLLAVATMIDERAEAHRNAEHAIKRAGHLVRQMVALARLDSDRQDELKTIDVAVEVRKLLASLIPDALAKSIELTLDSPDCVMLYGDKSALLSIVGNLVDNALRYSNEGGRIQVEIESSDGIITLCVHDNGSGIRLEYRERVFDRYFRVAGTDVSGSGLGLSIVKQAVARMQGKIYLEDGMDGRGCTFMVKLPTAIL